MAKAKKSTTAVAKTINMSDLGDAIIGQLMPLIEQKVDNKIKRCEIEQDKVSAACEDAYVELIKDVADRGGVRFATFRGRRGPTMLNMSEEAKAFIDSCMQNNKSWSTKRVI